ncbi:MAG: nucleotidyltransferase [Deltaproteobacteria bacterium]|nr:nucleotidyltransferase [Deltaproteobacteria bacterium]
MEASRQANRKASGSSSFREALQAVERFLDASGRPAAVIGGVAVIAYGFARSTVDIDASVAIEPDELRWLLEVAHKQGLVERVADAEAFARENLVLLLEHRGSRTPVDISLALQPFEVEALAAATTVLFGGVRIRVPRLSDLVVYKMVAGRPQDLRDVEVLLSAKAEIDLPAIEGRLAEFDSILETDRCGLFRTLLAKVMRPG